MAIEKFAHVGVMVKDLDASISYVYVVRQFSESYLIGNMMALVLPQFVCSPRGKKRESCQRKSIIGTVLSTFEFSQNGVIPAALPSKVMSLTEPSPALKV